MPRVEEVERNRAWLRENYGGLTPRQFTTAVVCGKFYPFHKGHAHLIQTASDAADRVAVIVIARPDQQPDGLTRCAWVRESFPTAAVYGASDLPTYPDDRDWARAFAEQTLDGLGYTPDAVFSSEDYGALWAEELGAEHVMVDRERVCLPISGTQIREDWFRYLPYIHGQGARRYYEGKIWCRDLAGGHRLSIGMMPRFAANYSFHAAVRVSGGDQLVSGSFHIDEDLAVRDPEAWSRAFNFHRQRVLAESLRLIENRRDGVVVSFAYRGAGSNNWHWHQIDLPTPTDAPIGEAARFLRQWERSFVETLIYGDDAVFEVKDVVMKTLQGEVLTSALTDSSVFVGV